MKKFINNATWFLLGVAATIFAIVIYAANNGGINTNGDNDEVYEDSAARYAIYSQVMAEYDTTSVSLGAYAPMLKTYFVSEMLKAGATDSINASAFVQELINEFLPILDGEFKEYINSNFSPEEIQEIAAYQNSAVMQRYMTTFGELQDRLQKIVKDPETFKKVKDICKKYGY